MEIRWSGKTRPAMARRRSAGQVRRDKKIALSSVDQARVSTKIMQSKPLDHAKGHQQ